MKKRWKCGYIQPPPAEPLPGLDIIARTARPETCERVFLIFTYECVRKGEPRRTRESPADEYEMMLRFF